MLKVGEIQLYKVGEIVKILNEKFNYKTNSQIICRKAAMLNAYVTYNDIRYIPADVISHLTKNIRQREIKTYIQTTIESKLASINKELSIYDKKYKIPPITAIKRIKTQNANTTTIVKAVLQLTEEIKNIKEQTQEEINNKNKEILILKKEIQNIKEKTQENIQIKLLKEVKAKLNNLNNLVYKDSKNNHSIKWKQNT